MISFFLSTSGITTILINFLFFILKILINKNEVTVMYKSDTKTELYNSISNETN